MCSQWSPSPVLVEDGAQAGADGDGSAGSSQPLSRHGGPVQVEEEEELRAVVMMMLCCVVQEARPGHLSFKLDQVGPENWREPGPEVYE